MAAETVENGYVRMSMNRKAQEMIDDLQWKREAAMSLNEQLGGCCVNQEDLHTPDALYTSMREGLKRIIATVKEPSIQWVCSRDGRWHLEVLDRSMASFWGCGY